MGGFFPSDSLPMVYFIIWETLGFPHLFPITQENATKPIAWGYTGKLVLILFPQYGCFFPIRFPYCGTLHQMGMHVFSHQFPIAWQMAAKVIERGKPGKLVPIQFP